MAAVSNRSKAATRRRTWDRFTEAVLAFHPFGVPDPLRMPSSQFGIENLLDTALEADIAKRHFEEVMANDSSSDLAIFAANSAMHAANRKAETAWDAFETSRRATTPAAQAA